MGGTERLALSVGPCVECVNGACAEGVMGRPCLCLGCVTTRQTRRRILNGNPHAYGRGGCETESVVPACPALARTLRVADVPS